MSKKSKKQGDLWEREAADNDDDTIPDIYELAPGEAPFCSGSASKPHEITTVTPVDRFSDRWRDGRGHECKKCGSQWCKHNAKDLEV